MKWPPPEKKGGACGNDAPTQETLELAEITASSSEAQICTHATTIIERPPGHPHHQALWCAHCGVFLRWLPKAQSVERSRLGAFKLEHLAMLPRLTEPERKFIRRLLRRCSPQQKAFLYEVVVKNIWVERKPNE